jgi:ketosteroid isomerase-like protein
MKTTTIAATLAAALSFPCLAAAQSQTEKQAAKDAIWTLEQSIYAGRAAGDLSNYVNNTSPDYVSWPPTVDKPMPYTNLKATASGGPKASKEHLTMEFMDIAVHGNTAIIYYKTHRTQRADGTLVDENFETTHTWVREDGHWQVLGGMARLKAKP